jgi:outer membrane receptor protein involved in Fe transport
VRIARALDVIELNGQAVCRSATDGQLAPDDPSKGATDPNCVPWNIWAPGGVTPEALAYLQTPGVLTGHTEHRIASASVSGDLGAYGLISPIATDGIGVALGTEYRHEAAVYDTDTAFATGDLAGQGAATIGTGGSFYVKELFGEVRVPIVQGKMGAEDLTLELGYRWSDYSSLSSSIDTYKVGLNYSPIRDIAIRGSYNRAVRAPNIIELYQPTRVALDGNTDPCANLAANPGCQNDPLFATAPELFDTDPTNGRILANPAAQYNGLFGTQAGLQEETADTYTAGFVFTPTFVKGLSLTVDYYNIEVEDLISGYGADNILAGCYDGSQPDFCSLINRNPSNGSLWQGNGYVTDLTLNTGSLKVEGVDITSRYKVAFSKLGLPDIGSLTVDLVATRADHYEVTPISGGDSYE